MKSVILKSDYAPDTALRITITDDGDCIFCILGHGEMRIATRGGHIHGDDLVNICGDISVLVSHISEINK